MRPPSIVLLGAKDVSTRMVYHRLASRFDVKRAIIEDPVPKTAILRGRMRKYGLFTAIGQILFRGAAVPMLTRAGRTRVMEIAKQFALNDSPIPFDGMTEVPSVNHPDTRELLRRLDPDLVVVNGTRIIASELLNSVSAPFVNMHAGITPAYRGVHGAYWALVRNDAGRCGVTVHLVDEGIDTGTILRQAVIEPTDKDNFCTYPYLQLAVGLPLLEQSVVELYSGAVDTAPSGEGPSELHTHPTLWEYLYYRVSKGVK